MIQAIKRLIQAYKQRQKVKAMRQAKLRLALSKSKVLIGNEYSIDLQLGKHIGKN